MILLKWHSRLELQKSQVELQTTIVLAVKEYLKGMIDLLPVLIKATTTIQKMMSEWFAGYPADRSWTIVSDYCVGDDNKKKRCFLIRGISKL